MGDRSITLRERDDEAPDPRMAADGCAGAATAAPSEDEPARAVAAARGRRAPTRAGAAGATPMMGTSRARKMDLTGTTVRRGKHVANSVGVGRAAPITGGAVIPKWSMTRLPRRPCPTPKTILLECVAPFASEQHGLDSPEDARQQQGNRRSPIF